ncbi:MAG: hypothetical protein FWG47_02705 [Propionibacteriaceae bacterium]|nr:hypothetical protein [Propionibacteriaceae bacterium]
MGFFDRFKKDKQPDEPEEVDDEQIVEYAKEVILAGFYTFDEAIESVRESFADTAVAEFHLDEITRHIWEQRLAEEAAWDAPGDYAKLATAFERLNTSGIVARMNFACCNTCGLSEIGDDLAKDADGRPVAGGFAFFHQQDSARLVDDGFLHLTFGAFKAAENLPAELLEKARAKDQVAAEQVRNESDRLVGVQIVAALDGVGLETEWEGDPDQRILVNINQWRKPLPTP